MSGSGLDQNNPSRTDFLDMECEDVGEFNDSCKDVSCELVKIKSEPDFFDAEDQQDLYDSENDESELENKESDSGSDQSWEVESNVRNCPGKQKHKRRKSDSDESWAPESDDESESENEGSKQSESDADKSSKSESNLNKEMKKQQRKQKHKRRKSDSDESWAPESDDESESENEGSKQNESDADKSSKSESNLNKEMEKQQRSCESNESDKSTVPKPMVEKRKSHKCEKSDCRKRVGLATMDEEYSVLDDYSNTHILKKYGIFMECIDPPAKPWSRYERQCKQCMANELHKHYKCKECGYQTHRVKSLRLHVVAKEIFKPVTCTVCAKVLFNAYKLNKHMSTIHSSVNPPLNCAHCSFTTGIPSRLAYHIRNVHEGAKYPCPWEGCTKSFKRRSTLDVHMLTHTDSKPVLCHLCGFSCRQKASLNWHMKSKHSDVNFPKRDFGTTHKAKVLKQRRDEDT